MNFEGAAPDSSKATGKGSFFHVGSRFIPGSSPDSPEESPRVLWLPLEAAEAVGSSPGHLTDRSCTLCVRDWSLPAYHPGFLLGIPKSVVTSSGVGQEPVVPHFSFKPP